MLLQMVQYFEYIIIILFADRIYCSRYRFEADDFLNITNKNIKKLDVANNNLPEIQRETFNKYQNLEQLNIINSKVYFVAEKAFYDLPYLRELNLSGNFITKLNSKIFRPHSNLQKFVVSFNKLSSIDDFDVGWFSELTFVDISNNHLRFLPASFLKKLENDRNFTLIADNNFWDCKNNDHLPLELCKNVSQAQALPLQVPSQASFWTCILWTAGSFWCGVIVGNMNTLRRLICPKKTAGKSDQSTQYDSITIHSAYDRIKINKASSTVSEIFTSKINMV